MSEQPTSHSGTTAELSEPSRAIVMPPLSRYAGSTSTREAGERTAPPKPPVSRGAPAHGTGPGRRARALRGRDDMLPVATSTPPEPANRERLPFWKRIALHRPGAAPQPPPVSLDPVFARLDELEKQIAANRSAMLDRLNDFEENFTRLWELEEQMSLNEVRERLALLQANQEEIADALHSLTRHLSLAAWLLAAALAAGALAAGILL